jgi:hypothetical protein
VEHPDQVALDDQRHAEQRPDPLLAQDRIQNVGVIDIGDEDGDTLSGDPAGKPLPQRKLDALFDLLLDSFRGAGHQLVGLRVVEQDRNRVDAQRFTDPEQELVEQLLELELGKRRVAQPVELRRLVGRRLDRTRLQNGLSDAQVERSRLARGTVGSQGIPVSVW